MFNIFKLIQSLELITVDLPMQGMSGITWDLIYAQYLNEYSQHLIVEDSLSVGLVGLVSHPSNYSGVKLSILNLYSLFFLLFSKQYNITDVSISIILGIVSNVDIQYRGGCAQVVFKHCAISYKRLNILISGYLWGALEPM